MPVFPNILQCYFGDKMGFILEASVIVVCFVLVGFFCFVLF